MRVEFAVFGSPAPQGSKRHVGGGRMIESSRKVKPWRQDVKLAAEAWIAAHGGANWTPIDGPILARMVFTVPKPTSAPKSRKTWAMRKPDLSKLIRSTEDALTDAGLIRDDARIVDYGRAAKVFPGEDAEALRAPGVRIVLQLLDHKGDSPCAETGA